MLPLSYFYNYTLLAMSSSSAPSSDVGRALAASSTPSYPSSEPVTPLPSFDTLRRYAPPASPKRSISEITPDPTQSTSTGTSSSESSLSKRRILKKNPKSCLNIIFRLRLLCILLNNASSSLELNVIPHTNKLEIEEDISNFIQTHDTIATRITAKDAAVSMPHFFNGTQLFQPVNSSLLRKMGRTKFSFTIPTIIANHPKILNYQAKNKLEKISKLFIEFFNEIVEVSIGTEKLNQVPRFFPRGGSCQPFAKLPVEISKDISFVENYVNYAAERVVAKWNSRSKKL